MSPTGATCAHTLTAARVSGHLKSTDCSDVSKASAPDKEAAPEGPISFEQQAVCVCVSVCGIVYVCVCVTARGVESGGVPHPARFRLFPLPPGRCRRHADSDTSSQSRRGATRSWPAAGPGVARLCSLVRCLDTFWLEQRCLILSDFFCRRPSFATLRQLRSDAQRVEMRLRAGQAKSLITSESSTRSCSTDSDHQRVQHSPLSDWLGSPASPALAAV